MLVLFCFFNMRMWRKLIECLTHIIIQIFMVLSNLVSLSLYKILLFSRKYMLNLKVKREFDVTWDDRWHYPLFTRNQYFRVGLGIYIEK